MGQTRGFAGVFRAWPLFLAVLAPAVLWGMMFVFFPPGRQEFPINDDCLFSRTAFAFARGEGLHYYNWASMPMLGQLLWAWPFVRLLGESHVALRISTMTLAILGLAALYDLLRREYACSPRRAAFLTACLGLNPLFFLLAYTFQTDAPALAFSLLGLACYTRGLRGRRIAWWAAGTALTLLAVMTRQNAVVVPLVAGVLLARQVELRRRPLWILAILVPVAAGVAVHLWFNRRPDVWAQSPRLPPLLTTPVLLFVAIHALGLFAAPVFPLPGRWEWKPFLVASAVMLCGVGIMAAINVAEYGPLFPYLGNWLTPWGQFSNLVVPGDRPLLMGREIRTALTIAGCLGAAVLAAGWMARSRAAVMGDPLLVFACFHFLLLPIAPYVFDRYFLVLLPAALILPGAAGPAPRWRGGLALAALAVYGFVSFAMLHDLLAWNAARWDVGRRALAHGASAEEIDGGFEWDGWFAPEAAAEKVNRPPRGLALRFTRKYFPNVTGRYALSFSVLPGCRVLDEEPYRQWLIPGEHRMFLLEATDDPSP